MYLHISVRSTGRESTKLQQSNEHSIQGPRRETTLTPKPCATESRGLIDISSRIVHSAANRPKQRSLRPVLENGVLPVGGRLQRAVVLLWDEKHPMILPKHDHVSQLIVRHYHEFAAHSGRDQTLCELRRKFWIISGRSLVKKIIRSCIRCRRMNAKPMEQFVGLYREQGWRHTNLHLPLLVLTYLGHKRLSGAAEPPKDGVVCLLALQLVLSTSK